MSFIFIDFTRLPTSTDDIRAGSHARAPTLGPQCTLSLGCAHSVIQLQLVSSGLALGCLESPCFDPLSSFTTVEHQALPGVRHLSVLSSLLSNPESPEDSRQEGGRECSGEERVLRTCKKPQTKSLPQAEMGALSCFENPQILFC